MSLKTVLSPSTQAKINNNRERAHALLEVTHKRKRKQPSSSTPPSFFENYNRGGLTVPCSRLIVLCQQIHSQFNTLVSLHSLLIKRSQLFIHIEHKILNNPVSKAERSTETTDEAAHYLFQKLVMKWLHTREKEFLVGLNLKRSVNQSVLALRACIIASQQKQKWNGTTTVTLDLSVSLSDEEPEDQPEPSDDEDSESDHEVETL